MIMKQRNVSSLVIGALLIFFGGLALFGQIFRSFGFWDTFWPFIIIGFGLMFFVGMLAGGKSVAFLAIPGSIITVLGLIFLVQNLFNVWESWAYSWSVIVVAVGLGTWIMGAWSEDIGQRRSGLGLMKIGLILFIIFGAFFEMIFSSSGIRQYFFPIALILFGFYLIITRSGLLSKRSNQDTKIVNPPVQDQ
jgi:hypothetical protein